MQLNEVRKLKELEKENTELKKLLTNELLRRKALEIALKKTSMPRTVASGGQASKGQTGLFQESGVPVSGVPSIDSEV